MFHDNKYTRIYHALMEKRKHLLLEKSKEYCERHHIIPKALGGTDEEFNLVNLLPREHFIAHLLLTKMVKTEDHLIKMHWALHKMSYGNTTDYFSGKDYSWHRKRHSKFLSAHHWTKTEQGRKRMSERLLKDWEENYDARRKRTRETYAKWRNENLEKSNEHLKRIAPAGARAAAAVVTKKIEYNGKTYLGWKGLKDETGISKHLYNRFYIHGIDPAFRVNKDGVMDKKDIDFLIGIFCKRVHIDPPKDKKELDNILNRMMSIGLISNREAERYRNDKTSNSVRHT